MEYYVTVLETVVSSTATDRSQESLHTKHRLVVQRERHMNTTNCIHS
jgi:hypothetical protein